MLKLDGCARLLIAYWHGDSSLGLFKYDTCRQLAVIVKRNLLNNIGIDVSKDPDAYALEIQNALAELTKHDIDARELISHLCREKSELKILSKVDVVILTALPEEYGAICTQLSRFSSLGIPPNMGSTPNNCSWQLGSVPCLKFNSKYNVVIGITGRPGNLQSAHAAIQAISLWKPKYLIFSGIAGGLPEKGLKNGDVVIADCIYGYEYGKIEEKFEPRNNWVYRTHQGLLTGAITYSLENNWQYLIREKPPIESNPKAISGDIASGEKVIDYPTNKFFIQVIKKWPKILAIEMEGAGIGSAIEQAQNLMIPVFFMVIRSISDLPRADVKENETRGTRERDNWKGYASDAAAAFTIGWIEHGLPLPPSSKK